MVIDVFITDSYNDNYSSRTTITYEVRLCQMTIG